MRDTVEGDTAEAMGWRPMLDACPEGAAVRIESAGLDAGEPWCVTQLAGLQSYTYDRPDLDDTPIRPDTGDRLGLTRRPDNHADANAVEVWWRNEHMFGHLPRGLAARGAPHLDRGVSLRAYALGPGTGAAWSVHALLVGTPVAQDHAVWLHHKALDAAWDMYLAAYAIEKPREARGEAFTRRQVRARSDRLTQAVRAFEAMPADPALVPPVGLEHDVRWLARHLGMSEALLARLVRDAGAAITMHMRGCYAIRPCTVLITPALRDAPLAWCAAPTARASRRLLAEAVAARRPDPDRPRGPTPDADEWRPLRPGCDG